MAGRTLLAALWACGVVAAGAQTPFDELRKLNNDAAALYAEGEYRQAEQLYRAALSQAGDDLITAATVANNLGALYKRLNRYAEAEQLYQKALALRRARLPTARPEIAQSMNNLAVVYRLEGRYWEARNLAEAAVQALKQADAQSPDMPIFLSNWASLELDLRRPEQAESLLREASARAEQAGDTNTLAIVMNTLADVLDEKREYEAAAGLYARAGAIFERAEPPSNHATAATLANLGRMQMRLGRTEEAKQIELRALALTAREPHPDGLLRAAILHNLANIAAMQGILPEALASYAESLRAHEGILGPAHLSLTGLLFDYAAVAQRAGERSQARKLRKRGEQLLARRRRDDLARYTIDVSAFVH